MAMVPPALPSLLLGPSRPTLAPQPWANNLHHPPCPPLPLQEQEPHFCGRWQPPGWEVGRFAAARDAGHHCLHWCHPLCPSALLNGGGE